MWTHQQLETSARRIGLVLPGIRWQGRLVDGRRRVALGAPIVDVGDDTLKAATWLAIVDPPKLHLCQHHPLVRADLPGQFVTQHSMREVTRRRVLRWAQQVREGEIPLDLSTLESLL